MVMKSHIDFILSCTRGAINRHGNILGGQGMLLGCERETVGSAVFWSSASVEQAVLVPRGSL